MLRRGYRELPQHFPQPGWVEHDPDEIWRERARPPRTPRRRGLDGVDEPSRSRTSARRRSLWDRATGRPVAPAIVWQDRRTAERCRELDADLIRERTGLVPDPYFSATKLEWLLRDRHQARPRVRDRRLVARLAADGRSGARRPTGRTHRGRCCARSRRSTGTTSCWRCSASTEALLPEIVRLGRRLRRGRAARRARPDPRHGGRPAGGALRAGLPHRGRGAR